MNAETPLAGPWVGQPDTGLGSYDGISQAAILQDAPGGMGLNALRYLSPRWRRQAV